MAANASMTISTFLRVAQLLPRERAVLIRGDHGIGKSSLVRQLAETFGIKPSNVIDYRLGQRTPGDVIGMPDLSNGVTVFRPPAELRRSCDEPCILFFDEANRAQEEVLQAVFQVCLDRVLPDGTPLHPDTRVYSAINAKARYSINRLDPALLDRFFVVDLNPDAPSWLSYGMRTGIASVILDFIRGKPDALFPVENGEVDSVQPTPRSWHFLSDALKSSGLVDDPKNAAFHAMCTGFIGNELASSFTKFAESVDNRVSGEDILEKYTADPVGTYDYKLEWHDTKGASHSRVEQRPLGKLQSKVKSLSMDHINGLIDALGAEVSKLTKVPTGAKAKRWGENIRAFCGDLPTEMKVSLWSSLSRKGVDGVDVVVWIVEWIGEDIVTGGFKVPVGEAGIGVIPEIPGALLKGAANASA
jgi:hypothetical protein